MKRSIRSLVILSSIGICALMVMIITSNNLNAEPSNYPVEAGPAKFIRDHDTAMEKAKTTGKPVFAFFQEVPG